MYEVYAYLALGRFVYVGSTNNQKRRFRDHRRKSQFCKDYPNGCFVILESNNPKSQIKEREEYWIAEYQVYEQDWGYNKTPKHQGGYDSKESREKNRITQLKRYEDPAEREKLRQAQKRRYEDPAEREKLSFSALALWDNPEYRDRHRKSLLNYHEKNRGKKRESHRTREAKKNAAMKTFLDGTHPFCNKKVSAKGVYIRRLNCKNRRRERYQLFASLLFTKALCDKYRTRKLEREGFFTKEVADTSKAEQLKLFQCL